MRDIDKTKAHLVSELVRARLRIAELEVEHKRAESEIRELEQKAQAAGRLASIDDVSSGIAHEISNPLTAVIGFAQLLLERDISKDVRRDVEVIHRGAQRIAGIINRLPGDI